MAKPLGLIRDQNPDAKAITIYALVLNGLITNTILASYNDILSIYLTYDYCIDIVMNGDPTACIGCTYNPSNDTFIHPPAPPINWPQNAQFDFDAIISALQQTISDVGVSGGSLNPTQINAAYNSALNDNPSIDAPTRTIMASVLQYVLAGG